MACPMGFSSPPPPPTAARDHDSSPTGKSSSSSHSPTSPVKSPHRSGSTTSCTAMDGEGGGHETGAKRKLGLKGLCQGLASLVFPSVSIQFLLYSHQHVYLSHQYYQNLLFYVFSIFLFIYLYLKQLLLSCYTHLIFRVLVATLGLVMKHVKLYNAFFW